MLSKEARNAVLASIGSLLLRLIAFVINTVLLIFYWDVFPIILSALLIFINVSYSIITIVSFSYSNDLHDGLNEIYED